MTKTRFALLVIVCALMGCGDDEQPSASEAPPAQAPAAPQPPEPGPPPPPVVQEPPPNRTQLPVADDFEAEVTEQIDEKNYRQELDKLEKEIVATEQ